MSAGFISVKSKEKMGNSVVCHLCSSLSHLSFICTFVTINNLVFYDSSADMHFFIETKKKTTEYKEYIY